MKIFLTILFIFLVITFSSPSAFAVRLKYINEKGTRIFACDWYCGDVRVKRMSKCEYRVFSITYKGDLQATSEKDAARIACLEKESPYTSGVERPSTGTGACN